MPRDFERCLNTKGHRVRTISGPSKQFNLEAGEFIKVCFLGDRMFRGHKHKKSSNG